MNRASPAGFGGDRPRSKHRLVYQHILDAIRGGEFSIHDKLPSDAELGARFNASRMTIIRALHDLQLEGYVRRRAGSGTYVTHPKPLHQSLTFGLLIPDLGGSEIFEPICRGMAQAEGLGEHALLWGNTPPGVTGKAEMARELCRFFIGQKVSGVFFAPLEHTANMDEVNRSIAADLCRASIPVVLLDRCFMPFPQRSRFDLVGIDNRRAGYRMSEHLFEAGCRTLVFFALPNSAPTVDARIAGFRDAHYARDISFHHSAIAKCRPDDEVAVRALMNAVHPDGIVCANDLTAGRLMLTLLALGYALPEDVRIVGIDDVKYAHLLSVPLTTLRQPCHEIGRAAVAAMFARLANPAMVTRDVLLDCEMVVRRSSSPVA